MSRLSFTSSPRTSSLRVSRRTGLLCVLALGSIVGSAALTGCSSGSSTTATNNGNNGSNGSNGSTGVAGRGTINLTFSNPSGTNATTSAFQSSMASGALGIGAADVHNLGVSGGSVSGSVIRTILLNVLSNGTAVVGTSYPFSDTSPTTLSYTEASTSGGTPKLWLATSGSVVVDSVTGKTYKLHIVNAAMSTGSNNDSASTGSFTLNGTAEVTVP